MKGPHFFSYVLLMQDYHVMPKRFEFEHAKSRRYDPSIVLFLEYAKRENEDECLNENVFTGLQEAKRLVEAWREEYNERRPHSFLGGKTPNEVARGEEKLTGTSN